MIFHLEAAMMRRLALLAVSLFVGWAVFAAEIPKKSAKLVNDYTGTFTSSQIADLENMLYRFSDSTSTQISVVIEETLDGYSEFDRSYDIAEAWGIGTKGNDNGALVYLAMQERKYHVQVGYGLEKSLPPSLVGTIMRQEAVPHFKNGDYYTGIKNACLAFIKASQGEYKAKKKKNTGFPTWMIVLFVIIVVIISSIGRRFRGYGTYGRRGYSGGFGGWGGGGWSSGSGGGGGGFGGFGGGSFGGSGAGGSW